MVFATAAHQLRVTADHCRQLPFSSVKISRAFSKAYLLLCLRDGRSVCSSVLALQTRTFRRQTPLADLTKPIFDWRIAYPDRAEYAMKTSPARWYLPPHGHDQLVAYRQQTSCGLHCLLTLHFAIHLYDVQPFFPAHQWLPAHPHQALCPMLARKTAWSRSATSSR